jgi:citrate lyase beta subunit
MDLYRSLLFVPAHKADWARKAQRYEPDAVILDLEDGVPFSEKPLARQSARELVGELATRPRQGEPSLITCTGRVKECQALPTNNCSCLPSTPTC